MSAYNHNEGRLGTAAEIHRSRSPKRSAWVQEELADNKSFRRDYELKRRQLSQNLPHKLSGLTSAAEIEAAITNEMLGMNEDDRQAEPSCSCQDQDERAARKYNLEREAALSEVSQAREREQEEARR